MTPERFSDCADTTGWSDQQIADKCSVTRRQVGRWRTGASEVPVLVAGWISVIAERIVTTPAPSGRLRAGKEPS